MLVVTTQTTYTNQNDEVLCILRAVQHPPLGPAAPEGMNHGDRRRASHQKADSGYDDVQVGQEMPPLVIGPMTPTHLFRWSAAIENWHRIHYDQNFAVYHDGLPNILATGLLEAKHPAALSEGYVPAGRLAVEGAVPASRDDRSRRHHHSLGHGDRQARVADGLGLVEMDVGMRLQSDIETCPGTATIVLPIRAAGRSPIRSWRRKA